MTTVVANAVEAVVAALQASPAVSANVVRVQMQPFDRSVLTAVSVRPLAADRDISALSYAGPDVWAVRLAVDCYVRTSIATDLALDILLQAVYARLMADPTLAGAVPGGIAPAGVTFDFEPAADQFAVASLQLIARMPAGPDFT